MNVNLTTRLMKQTAMSLIGGAFLLSTQVQARAYESTPSQGQPRAVFSSDMTLAQVVPEQSQLVYYYPESVNAGPINIYVDKEFHTALLPGEFTTLCVASGQHILAAAVNDAPLYQQKASAGVHANFNGGKTYFVRAALNQGVVSEATPRQQAEQELQQMNKAERLVNRASSVQQCRYVDGGSNVTLIVDSVLFRFAGSSYSQLLPESQQKLERIIAFTKNANNVGSIAIRGYTDGIGNAEANRRLSQARAETVRQALINAGINSALISAEGEGIAPSASGCSKRQNDGCNTSSRRVEIKVNGH